MKYLLFDEMCIKDKKPILGDKHMNAICFCVFDDLGCIKKIKTHIKLSNIGNDYPHFNKLYPHYTEDNLNARNKFIFEILSKNPFKIFITLWSEDVKNPYETEHTVNLFKSALLKFRKFGIHEICLIFEEGNQKKYAKLGEICKTFNVKPDLDISKKEDLFSCIPDYILGIVKDFIINCCNKDEHSPKRKNNTSRSEQYLDLISSKISLCRINIEGFPLCEFCFSKGNYSSWKQSLLTFSCK